MSQVTDKVYHIMLKSSTPRLSGIRTRNFGGDKVVVNPTTMR